MRNRKSSEPGKDWISPETRSSILEIKLSNSEDRSGRITTEGQRKEMLRQMEVEKGIAAKEGREADVKFFEGQCDKIRKKKLSKPRIK